MFGSLKKKLKEALNVFSKEAKEEEKEIAPQEIPLEIKEELDKESNDNEDSQVTDDETHPHKEEEVANSKECTLPQAHTQEVPLEVHDTEKRVVDTVIKADDKPLVDDATKGNETYEENTPINTTEQLSTLASENKNIELPSSKGEEKPKKGLFSSFTEKFTTVQLSEEKFDEIFFELELALLENNVAFDVIEKIKEDLSEELTSGRIARGNVEQRIKRTLQTSIKELLDIEPVHIDELLKEHSPLIIAVVGINGSGKTTSAAKLSNYFQKQGKSVVLAAADTFRAAAIQQLEEHAKKLHVPLIKHEYGADPAAVAFDSIEHAKSKKKDVVIIDTAGRLHSNTNLMDELKKVIRVAKPHLTLFVGEAVTGNDCVEQAQKFQEALTLDGVILTKADVDEKGGAALSISYVINKPILFLGTGQSYDDFVLFDKEYIINQLFSSA